jgi:hypothetical protein
MKKLVTVVSNVHVQLLFCCSAAVSLTACGGGTDFAKDRPTQTAAQSSNSGTSVTGATFGITDDAPAGTAIPSGTEANSGATIAPANDASGPMTPQSAKAAPGATIKPRYDPPASTTIPSSAETASDTGPDGSTPS